MSWQAMQALILVPFPRAKYVMMALFMAQNIKCGRIQYTFLYLSAPHTLKYKKRNTTLSKVCLAQKSFKICDIPARKPNQKAWYFCQYFLDKVTEPIEY